MQMFELNTNEPCSIILETTKPVESDPPAAVRGLDVLHVASDDLVIVSKRRPGLSEEQAEALRGLIRAVKLGQAGPCKFLVLDLAPEGNGVAPPPPPNLEALLDDLSDLIFEAPVIPVAWARGMVAQADLELALSCSVLVGETDARFSFDVDLVGNLRSYALLAHKLGFVRAERLMEAGVTLDAPGLHELMLLNATVPPRAGHEGIRSFVAGRARRHNSACGIYRAQRLAMLRFAPRAA